jgi:hypothetical protein
VGERSCSRRLNIGQRRRSIIALQRCVDHLNRANSIIGWNSTSWPWRIARNARARHSPLTVEMECHRPLFRRTPVRTFPQPIGLPFRDRSALLVDKADTLNDEPAEVLGRSKYLPRRRAKGARHCGPVNVRQPTPAPRGHQPQLCQGMRPSGVSPPPESLPSCYAIPAGSRD